MDDYDVVPIADYFLDRLNRLERTTRDLVVEQQTSESIVNDLERRVVELELERDNVRNKLAAVHQWVGMNGHAADIAVSSGSSLPQLLAGNDDFWRYLFEHIEYGDLGQLRGYQIPGVVNALAQIHGMNATNSITKVMVGNYDQFRELFEKIAALLDWSMLRMKLELDDRGITGDLLELLRGQYVEWQLRTDECTCDSKPESLADTYSTLDFSGRQHLHCKSCNAELGWSASSSHQQSYHQMPVR